MYFLSDTRTYKLCETSTEKRWHQNQPVNSGALSQTVAGNTSALTSVTAAMAKPRTSTLVAALWSVPSCSPVRASQFPAVFSITAGGAHLHLPIV